MLSMEVFQNKTLLIQLAIDCTSVNFNLVLDQLNGLLHHIESVSRLCFACTLDALVFLQKINCRNLAPVVCVHIYIYIYICVCM